MAYTVRLVSIKQRAYAHHLIDQAPDYAVVTVKAGDRTLDQNAKMWAMLNDISRACPEGRRWIPETWKCAFMQSLGHQVKFAEGLDGSGPFPIGFQSKKLSKKQMIDLINTIYEYGDRNNVQWTEEPKNE